MLEKAYACLDAKKNYRARALQKVTLINSDKEEMEVTPHLTIFTQVWVRPPASEAEAQSLVSAARDVLEPIYEIVTEQAKPRA
jgi:hypothetical protein